MKEDKEELDDLQDVRDIDVEFEEVNPDEEPKKELTLEETKQAVAALRNIPYVKILNEEGDIVNPINGSYPNYFSNRRERKALIKKETKNPKNNKKGARVVVTKIGELSYTKTHIKKQRVEKGIERNTLNSDCTITKGTKIHKARTIVHNQIKEN